MRITASIVFLLFIMTVVYATYITPDMTPKQIDSMLNYTNLSGNIMAGMDSESQISVGIYKLIDLFLYLSIEIARGVSHYVLSEGTGVNIEFLFWTLMVAVILGALYPLVKFTIVIWIVVKEYLTNKKEKNTLDNLKLSRYYDKPEPKPNTNKPKKVT